MMILNHIILEIDIIDNYFIDIISINSDYKVVYNNNIYTV